MIRKQTFILLVIFTVLLVAVFLRGRLEKGSKGISLFKNGNIITVSVKENSEEKFHLEKKDSNWFMASGWPAAGNRVEIITRELESLKLKDIISKNPQRFNEFKVTPDNGAEITVVTDSGEQNVFYLGKESRARTGVYLRVAGSTNVYLAGGLNSRIFTGTDNEYWKDPYIFKDDFSKIENIEAETGESPVSVNRSDENFKDLTFVLSDIKITEAVKKEELPAGNPVMMLQYRFNDSRIKEFKVEKAGEKYYVETEGAPASYLILPAQAGRLLEAFE